MSHGQSPATRQAVDSSGTSVVALVALVCVLTAAPTLADPPCDGVCLYASPAGTGTACSFAAPCSLSTGVAAIDLALPLSTDLHLVLRGGTYALTQPITLGPEHSGSGAHRVFIENYTGETPILSGGTQITGWSLHDATKNIYRAVVAGDASARQLYVNGVRAQRARGYINADYQKTDTGYTLVGFPTSWPDSNITDLEFVMLEHWKSLRCPVSSIAPSGGTTAIDFAAGCWSDAQAGEPYFYIGKPDWMENAYELIDEPGEWYLNRTTDLLYYKPRTGESMATAEVVLPRTETLVRFLNGFEGLASNIVLKGLTFAHTNWTYADSGYIAWQAGIVGCNSSYSPCPAGFKPPAAVSLDGAADVRVERCTFEHLGGSGISVSGPSLENEIEGNVLRDIASTGIIVGDVLAPPPTSLAMTSNIVRNNFVTDIGRDHYDAAGILVGFARQTQVKHNELRNLPYTGISVGWGWGLPWTNDLAHLNQIESNLGAHVMQRLWDGGQVYTLSVQTDSSIAQNYFHNSIGVFGGIYLDNGTQGYSVQSNVVTSTETWAALQTWVGDYLAINNVVQDNFADNAVFGCGTSNQCLSTNVVVNNQAFTPGTWPEGTWPIVGQAGIEPAYSDIRGTATRVEAEDYNTDFTVPSSGHYDTTAGNAFGEQYRWLNVNADVSFCATCSNDHMVVAAATEWLRYYVDATAGGAYDFTFRVSTTDAVSSIQVDLGGYAAGTLALPNTGGAWADVSLPGVLLPKGPSFLRLTFGGQPRIDAFTYSRAGFSCPGTTPTYTLTANFDDNAGTEQLRVFQAGLCWDVATGGRPPVWMAGWGGGSLSAGDFNGDDRDDALVIYNDGSQWHWHLALSTGYRFEKKPDALVGWGPGNQLLVGDYDGDGKDDAVVILYDTSTAVWRWHLAESTGSAFTQHPNAQVGYGNGTGACVKDYDSDGKDEIVVTWTPNICADLNVSTHTFTMTTPCLATCN